jgi:hypothetical protein
MKQKEIEEFLKERPGYLRWGAGKLANYLQADVSRCKKALKAVKGDKIKTHEENLILNSRWFNGKQWCESFRNVASDPDPITPEEWKEILADIGPIESLTSLNEPLDINRTLIVWSSDKHIGAAIPSDSLYKRQYDQHIFHERIIKIFDKVVEYKHLYGKFDKIIIADLGDSLDGMNGLTTRGGHHLPQNLNNKQAARVHFFSHKWLYDSVVQGDIANEVIVFNVTNDNHSGDFGWHACFALEQYATLRWPNIKFYNQEEFLGHYLIYNRAYITTHGKDKKNKKFGLPLKVNADVESFMMDYAIDRKFSHLDLHIRKGDLHMNDLDCSRLRMTYFNVGSVFGASDWIMDNYSDSKPSCVFEVVEEGNNDIDAKIVWL